MSSERRRSTQTSLTTATKRHAFGTLLIWFAAGGILFLASGCGHRDGPARIAVFGTVKSKSGGPVNGTISFLPEAPTKGPAANASLVKGEFKFDTGNGPVAGRHRVLVVKAAAESKRKTLFIPASGETAPAATPHAPREALDGEWSFTAEVSPDQVKFDFQGPPR